MVKRSRLACGAAVAGLVATLLIGGSAASGAPSETGAGPVGTVPAALEPPVENLLDSVYQGDGVQVYECADGAWTFVEPAATLTGHRLGGDRDGGERTRADQNADRLRSAGRDWRGAAHFRGPSWQSTRDGSLVEAEVVASAPVTDSIPQLLLRATLVVGEGDFGAVTYIQRLTTSGGTAPVGDCADGARAGVPYRALYRFFVAD